MARSDINKIEEGQEVLGTVKVDDSNMTWDELEDIYKDISTEIIDLQMLIVTMSKQNEDKINKDPKLFGIVSGLLKTLTDVSKETIAIRNSFANGPQRRVGKIIKGDEEATMTWLSASASFVDISMKFSNLSSTAITDILTMLNLDHTLQKKAEDLRDTISNKG